MKVIGIFMVIGIILPITFAADGHQRRYASSKKQNAADYEEIKNLEQQWLKAITDHNEQALNRMLADSFTFNVREKDIDNINRLARPIITKSAYIDAVMAASRQLKLTISGQIRISVANEGKATAAFNLSVEDENLRRIDEQLFVSGLFGIVDHLILEDHHWVVVEREATGRPRLS